MSPPPPPASRLARDAASLASALPTLGPGTLPPDQDTLNNRK